MRSQNKYLYFGIFTVTLCVLALYIHQHRQGDTGKIDNLLTSATGGMQTHFGYLTHGLKAVSNQYVLLVNAQKRNEELLKELEEIKSRLAQFQEMEVENRRLASALDFKKQVEQKLISSRVIAHDVAPDFVGIRIDRGSLDGVRIGQGVISPSGIVGRVFRVFENYSDVMTLVDPSSNIDAVIQRSRARGVVSGVAKTLSCRLKYMDRLEDVAVNDTVISTDFGDIFPKGLLIGYVTGVELNANGILQNISVKAAVDIYSLEEVFIVLSPAKSEKARS